MAYQGVEVRPDGSLYCDIDVEKTFGLRYRTPTLNIPVKYDPELFKSMAEIFVTNARATCPVDTGFLRDHNDAQADKGGVEMWSEATYSVYQEYGTSRCRAQPWFESSVQLAIESTNAQDTCANLYNTYLGLEQELVIVQSMRITSIAEGQQAIAHLRKAKDIAEGIGFPVEEIDEAIEEIEEQMAEIAMMEQQMAAMPELGPLVTMFIQIIVGIIVGLISSFIRNLFDFSDREESTHNPSH